MGTEKILKERGERYGEFEGNAKTSQRLKRVWQESDGLRRLSGSDSDDVTPSVISEGMEMILHKIARICNGDPLYDDSWADIAGYAELVANHLKTRALRSGSYQANIVAIDPNLVREAAEAARDYRRALDEERQWREEVKNEVVDQRKREWCPR